MENDKFDIAKTIEQKPFEKYSFAKFFEDWCRKNGAVMPKVISRPTWKRLMESGVIQKSESGEQELLIPQDLTLWEMVGMTEAIQRGTFPNDLEKQKKMAEETEKLGKTFRNAGIYIAQRYHSISDGKEIARALAEELYKYGDALSSGEKTTEALTIEKIAEEEMSSEELDETDKFLAGDSLYVSRQERVIGGSNEEAIRQETLAQFFRAAQKAFCLEKRSESGGLSLPKEEVDPWKKDAPIHSEFLRKIEDTLKREIETSKNQLVDSVFQRGMDLLRTNMPLPGSSKFDSIDRLITFWEKSGASLGDALGIYRMRSELEKIRQTGDIAAVSKKEKEITDKIQQAVSSYRYKEDLDSPSEIIATREINCVGASTLAGSLLSQTGIQYLVGDVPEHSILVVAFSDGKVEWRDMVSPKRNGNITEETLEGNTKDGKPLTVSDIAEFVKNPLSEKVTLDIKGDEYKEKFSWIGEGQRQYLAVFPPAMGHKVQMLDNAGNVLIQLGKEEKDASMRAEYFGKASEDFQQSILIDPKGATSHDGLGDSFFFLHRYEEARKAYEQSIMIDPKNKNPYFGLGNTFSLLSRNEDAIRAYRQFISLADPKEDNHWIDKAEELIKKLETEEGGS